MKQLFLHNISRVLLLQGVVLLAWSCANRGMGPQGGPKDTTPPKIVKETPVNGSVNVSGNVITLQFDEYVVLEDASNQVLISPPQKKMPVVRAVGKKVTVEFEEGLADSTTYTIDFGTAICDNNEKNPLGEYKFSFSTGDVIDSLEMSGVLINAENLNPVAGVYVGVHSDMADSALSTQPFRSIAKTNSKGEFRLVNLAPGNYHVFALNDASKDFLYQPGEGLAFLDTVFSPFVLDSISLDTTRTLVTDSANVDSLGQLVQDSVMQVTDRHMPVYGPSGIVLKYFMEDKQRHYFQRCKRDEAHYFHLLFSAPQDEMPTITWNYTSNDSTVQHINPSAFILQPSEKMDTITVWITDSAYIKQDTLSFLLTYMMTDSLYNLVPQTDTISAIYRAPRISDKAKEAMAKNKKEPVLEVKTSASPSFDIYNPLVLTTKTPINTWQAEGIRLYEMNDTIRVPISYTLEKMDSSSMRLAIRHPWKPSTNYELQLDSAAFIDIYGVASHPQTAKLKVKSLDEYSTLKVLIEPYNQDMMVQVMSEKDVPVRTLRAQPQGVVFEYLKPESYYIRVYEDANADSVWTTGDYQKHRQPEQVYYFPNKLTLRANWDFEETVKYLEGDLLNQKPQELVKVEGNSKK